MPSLFTTNIDSLSTDERRFWGLRLLRWSAPLALVAVATVYAVLKLWPRADGAIAAVVLLIVFPGFVGLAGVVAGLYVLASTSPGLKQTFAALGKLFWVAVGLLVVAAGVTWLFEVVSGPMRPANNSRYELQLETLRGGAALVFGFPVRVEERAHGNVRLYVPKSAYEAIPFPDRNNAIESFAEPWCASVSVDCLPAVTIHDIKTGKKIHAYSCTWYQIREEWKKPAPGRP